MHPVTTSLSFEQIFSVLSGNSYEKIYLWANELRSKFKGNKVFFRAIIEFSNYCKSDCLYCGLRRSNFKLKRYRINEDEILKEAKLIIEKGFRTIVLQSGEDPYWNCKRLSRVVSSIKSMGAIVTLSVGDLSFKEYKLLREAGADRYLLKHETVDEKLFSTLRPGKSLKERIKRLFWLKELGFEVGTGCIVGLPGQSIESLVDDLLFIKKLKPEMVAHGPFIPHPDTPLRSASKGSIELTLKMIALTRILLPFVNLPATTALGVLGKENQFRAFEVGANVIMPDLTPFFYKRFYDIYEGKSEYRVNLKEFQEKLINMSRTTDLRK